MRFLSIVANWCLAVAYLAEISLAPEQWFKKRGSDETAAISVFDDKDNVVRENPSALDTLEAW